MAYRAMEPQVAEQCRVCLSTLENDSSSDWRNIFTDSATGLGKLLFIIEEVTGRKVLQDENLPERICHPCWAMANIAYNFKRRLEKSLQLMEQTNTNCLIGESFSDEELEETIDSFSDECEMIDLESLIEDHSEDSKTGEELPFKCAKCSKTFSQTIDLTKHLRTHPNDQHLECSPGLRTLRTRSDLQISDLTNHFGTHTGERPFECYYCWKTFKLKGNLKEHIRTHTGERPFKCSECSKAFSTNSKLTNHFRIHTGEKPFKCSRCPRTFTHRSGINSHRCSYK